MAVYTQVSAETLTGFLADYDQGELVSAKGIAEGVQNSNYLVDTTTGRFILTLYETRTDIEDLPFFLALLDHLARHGSPVPPALPARDGVAVRRLEGRPACLIAFLPGVSVSRPTPAQARAAAGAMAGLHAGVADFAPTRPNSLGAAAWRPLLEACAARDMAAIWPGLYERVSGVLDALLPDWPDHLPRAAIHADLFPDNVLMLDDRVTGLIDFYFACTELRAYDLAVMHGAWMFDATGTRPDPAIGRALLAGYDAGFGLSAAERAALPVLAQGACVRFLLTRVRDWLDTPPDALVVRKDPLAYWRRLEWYRANPSAFA